MQWFIKALKNFGDFKSRARRSEYWYYSLFVALISIGLVFVDVALGTYSDGIGLMSGLFSLAMIVPNLAVTVRRLHDIGRSGWWYLIILIPIIGAFILLYWMVCDSEPGVNQYGPSPKQNSVSYKNDVIF